MGWGERKYPRKKKKEEIKRDGRKPEEEEKDLEKNKGKKYYHFL